MQTPPRGGAAQRRRAQQARATARHVGWLSGLLQGASSHHTGNKFGPGIAAAEVLQQRLASLELIVQRLVDSGGAQVEQKEATSLVVKAEDVQQVPGKEAPSQDPNMKTEQSEQTNSEEKEVVATDDDKAVLEAEQLDEIARQNLLDAEKAYADSLEKLKQATEEANSQDLKSFVKQSEAAKAVFLLGSEVVVLEDFKDDDSYSDDAEPIVWRAGCRGIVIKIDEDGDFLILFSTGMSGKAWVFKEKACKVLALTRDDG